MQFYFRSRPAQADQRTPNYDTQDDPFQTNGIETTPHTMTLQELETEATRLGFTLQPKNELNMDHQGHDLKQLGKDTKSSDVYAEIRHNSIPTTNIHDSDGRDTAQPVVVDGKEHGKISEENIQLGKDTKNSDVYAEIRHNSSPTTNSHDSDGRDTAQPVVADGKEHGTKDAEGNYESLSSPESVAHHREYADASGDNLVHMPGQDDARMNNYERLIAPNYYENDIMTGNYQNVSNPEPYLGF